MLFSIFRATPVHGTNFSYQHNKDAAEESHIQAWQYTFTIMQLPLQLLQEFSLKPSPTLPTRTFKPLKTNMKFPCCTDFPTLPYSWKILQYYFVHTTVSLSASSLQRKSPHKIKPKFWNPLDSPRAFLFHNANLLSWSLALSFLCIMHFLCLSQLTHSCSLLKPFARCYLHEKKNEVYRLTNSSPMERLAHAHIS